MSVLSLLSLLILPKLELAPTGTFIFIVAWARSIIFSFISLKISSLFYRPGPLKNASFFYRPGPTHRKIHFTFVTLVYLVNSSLLCSYQVRKELFLRRALVWSIWILLLIVSLCASYFSILVVLLYSLSRTYINRSFQNFLHLSKFT